MSRLAPFTPAEIFVCIAAGGVAAAAALVRGNSWLLRFGACVIMGFLGLLNATLRPMPSRPSVGLQSGLLTGCVAEPAVVREGRTQFTLEIRPGAAVRISIPAARDGAAPPLIPFGRMVTLQARLREVRGYHNPGSFDLEQWNARRGIFWYGTTLKATTYQLHGTCLPGLRRQLQQWRDAALTRINELYPGDTYRAAMMRGLLLGDKAGIRQAWIDDFRRTGTYHALIISGSHITLVCGLFLLWRRYLGYGARTLLVLSASTAWLYALLAGGDPPVLRAAAGFTLFAAASFFYRRTSVLNLLAAVTLVFLAFDPQQLFDASFQLSFLAVAAIGAFSPERRTSRVPEAGLMARQLELRLFAQTIHLTTRLSEAVALSILNGITSAIAAAWSIFRLSAAVQAGLALPMVIYFHRLSITGLTANVLAVPVISQAIPFGFLAVFTGWRLPAAMAGWLLDFAQKIAGWHARLEPAWRIPDPPLWLCLLLTASLILCALPLPRTSRALALIATVALLTVLVVHPFEPRFTQGGLELSAIDVGQGESLLAALPDGEMVVIDGGGLPRFNRRTSDTFDIGEDVVSPYLWSRGIRRLAAVAVTHLHDDHAGGVDALLENFRPRELWTGFSPDHPAWRRLDSKARALGIRVRILKQGESFSLGQVDWKVLAPAPAQPWSGKPRNNDSLVLLLRYGRSSFLLTGDIEHGVEGRLLEEQAIGRIDVLKLAHHGSRLSSFPALLDVAQPSIAIISAGQGNSYGLPHPATIEALRQRRTVMLRTDMDGLVSVHSDGKYFALDSARSAPAPWSLWDLF